MAVHTLLADGSSANTSRRGLMKLAAGACGAGAAFVGVAGAASAARLRPAGARAEIVEAERLWSFINDTRAQLSAMNDDEDGDLDHPLWEELGAAEMALCAITSPSPRVAEMHLWLTLDHSNTVFTADIAGAIDRRDAAELAACKHRLDFNDKLIVSALHTVRSAQEA